MILMSRNSIRQHVNGLSHSKISANVAAGFGLVICTASAQQIVGRERERQG